MTSRSLPDARLADIYNPSASPLTKIGGMNSATRENTIDYIELFARHIEDTKKFYSSLFNWKFEDYGPDYTSFSDGRLAGGFTTDALGPAQGVLLVLCLRLTNRGKTNQRRRRLNCERDFFIPRRPSISLHRPKRK
jgi:hypothetical protein